ncbi:hypothetical protein [Nocardia iowensis]|uniref:Uncharacterized protein n=1 Tax=Nocardia iowensis TaxID=204891 RepID=A0ABX8RHG3_NOCIO|nr:hypothetical protein [Nocardia iowensis]QXN88781.1 hypothetical protein KV110_24700 [Nocardia iowensis]
MWLYAVWGCIGAAVNCGVVFVEASTRVKGWPWGQPEGPGGGVYAAAVVVQICTGAATSAAVLSSGLITPNILIAFGIGTGTPVVLKKLSFYVQSLLPGDEEPQDGRKGYEP